jgi:hypothetical protein
MSQQIICDECGEPIDPTKPHYQLNGSKVQEVGGAMIAVDSAVALHYHEEHLPVYKIAGEPVEPPEVTPEPPEGETPAGP